MCIRDSFQQRDGLVSIGGKTLQPSDPILVILQRFKAQRVGKVIGELQTIAWGQGQEVSAESRALNSALRVLLEKIVVQLIRRTESRARDTAKVGQRRCGVSEALFNRPETDIVPAIIGPAIAERGSVRRTLIEFVFPFFGEKAVQRCGWIVGLGRWCLRQQRRPADQRDEKTKAKIHC